MKDRISEHEDKKEKTEELLVKQLKTCERNIKELTDSIKRPNLRIMGIEGEEVQAKEIHNILNKIITENSPNHKKVMAILVQDPSGHQDRTSPPHIIVKTTSTKNREQILNVVREKKHKYKGKPIKITADFSMESLKGRKA
jgi:hypothetical protein